MYTNDFLEALDLYGIEAARVVLLKELKGVVQFDGSYVNHHHFSILADTMTYKGSIMAITRHGINKNLTGPLMRCSFEETVDVLLDAAIYSENDKLSGIAENITLGKPCPLGTNNFELFMSE